MSTVGSVQTVPTLVGGDLGFHVLDVAISTSLILAIEMFVAFEELSTGSVTAGVANLHLSAVVGPAEIDW